MVARSLDKRGGLEIGEKEKFDGVDLDSDVKRECDRYNRAYHKKVDSKILIVH